MRDHLDLAQSIAVIAWNYASSGRDEIAEKAYSIADETLPSGRFNPALSLLRHTVGKAGGGVVETTEGTEDWVASYFLPDSARELDSEDGLEWPAIDTDALEKNIRIFIDELKPGFHRENITTDLPHVMVMSTGRCGTMSLYHLFKDGNLIPYHSYWWQNPVSSRWEMAARLMSGNIDPLDPNVQEWYSTRAAEWLGAMGSGRPMIGLNHMDTIYAPAFAVVHPLSKFVYLHRDRVKVFESFFGKGQWMLNQLAPVHYRFNPEFEFYWPNYAISISLAWYIRFTEAFARAIQRVMGERFMEVRSEDLFSGNRDEIGRLLEFTGANIPVDDAVDHFKTKINAKAHKATEIPDSEREIFKAALCQL